MPFRTGDTYTVPGKGTYNTKKKTYTGKGKAPSGYRKVKAPKPSEVPTTTVSPEGKITTSGYRSRKTAQKARRKTRSAQRRARRIAASEAERPRTRESEEIFRKARRLVKAPPSPQAAISAARLGVKPPESKRWREAFPKAARKADEEFIRSLGSKEGLKEDPLAELAISTVATAGLGAAAKGVATVAKGALAGRATEKAVEAGTKGVAARTASRAGTKARAGAKGTVAKERARQARNLARHESQQAAKRASRRIRPKARYRAKFRAKRRAKDEWLRYGTREGRKVGRRTRSVKVGLLSPYATATSGGVAGLGVAGAAIEGHVEAIKKSPGTVAKRTIEIAPGLVVSTADLAAQAAIAAGTGNSAGLRKRIEEEVSFAKELASVMASGDKERVRRYVEENGLIAPLIAAPTVARLGRRPISRTARELAPEASVKRSKRKAKRKQLSRDASRVDTEAQMEIAAAGQPVVRAYTGHRGRKGVGKRRKLRDKPVDRGDVAALAAEEGLTPASAAANFEAVAAKWGNRPVFGDKREGGVTGHELIDYVARDPGVWKDKAFWRTVDAYRAQEPAVRTSEGVIDVEQAKTHGVQLTEDRPPPAARPLVPKARSREEVAGFISKGGEGGKRVRRLRETIRAAEGKARELRAELRQIEVRERSRQRRAGGRLEPMGVTNRRRQQLLDAEADIRGMRAELAGTRKRHQTIAQSLRDPAQQVLAKEEFDAELAAVREDRGLVRGVYVPHTDVGREGLTVAQPMVQGGKKIHRRRRDEGSLAEQGRVDYSLKTIVQAGIEAPRLRKAVHGLVNRTMHEEAKPILVDGKVVRVATREQFERGLSAAEKREVVLWPLSQFNQAVKQGDVQAMTDLVTNLGKEIEEVKGTPKSKYVALDKDFALELKAQISAPGSALQRANQISRGISRTILASPAWAAAQIVAESLQAAHAINPLNPANIYHAVQGRRGLRGMSLEKRREFEATAGARPPGQGSVSREFMTVDGRSHGALAGQFTRMQRVLPLKRLIQAVRLDWLNYIDRAKTGGIATTVAVTKAHKDAVGFGKSLQRLVKGQHELSKKLAKMTPEQRLQWAIRDTPAKREIESYNADVLGNWRAFSRKEKAIAPALIFYGFARMSFQWPFYTFPKRHPVRAAVMYEMAASHNAQLRELLGGPPGWLSNFGNALIYGNEPGQVKIINASRIIPGAGAIFEAVSGGFDVAAQRGLNPVVGYFNALVNGIDPLSGEKVDEHKSAEEAFIARAGLTLSLLFNTPPPISIFDTLRGSKEATALPIIGPRREQSALGEVIEELSGTPTERATRRLLNPFPSQDLPQARDAAALQRIFEIWRVDGSDAQDAVINDETLSKGEKKRRLKQMRSRSDEADAELNRLYRKYAKPGWEAEQKRSSEEYFDLKYPDEESDQGGQYGGGGQYSGKGQYAGAGQYGG